MSTTDTTDEATEQDPFAAGGDAAEGHVYTVTGQDWDSLVSEQAERGDERIVVNMGPQHPSTHGVLRLDLGTRGRVRYRSPLRHRLLAYRNRKEHGVP